MKISASAFAAAIAAAHENGRRDGFDAGWEAGVEFVVNGGETDAVGKMAPLTVFPTPSGN